VGAAYAVLGALLWPLTALGAIPYPGSVHASLMVEGFEQAFISGFLLTVLPRFTRTASARPWEIAVALALAAGFGVAWTFGKVAAAHALFGGSLLLLLVVAASRLRVRQNDPPEEFVFVVAALGFGLAGAAIQVAAAMGAWVEPSYRFGLRLVSLGLVLTLVLGVGALLVPVFLGVKDPLVIPKIARPHERPARRVLYAVLIALLAIGFVLDARGQGALGNALRAAVAAFMLLVVWKIGRRPRVWSAPSAVLWSAGWLVLLGLVLAACDARHVIAALHVTMLGGFGALTIAIASRVVVTHGGHGPNAERRLLTLPVATALGLALILRLVAEWAAGGSAPWFLAASALAWIAAWSAWLVRALPRIAPA